MIAEKEKITLQASNIDENGNVSIIQEMCVGCGLCAQKCSLHLIQIKQTMPMRKNLMEYFDTEFNVGLRL